jgi:hypothetical protein
MMRGPTFVIELQAAPGNDGIHALRALLKNAWRHHRLRCLHAREKSSEQSNTVYQEEIPMDANDLARLRDYASTSRSSTGLLFGGATFISFDWKTGAWLAGKNQANFTNKQLVADLGDVMGGYQRLEKGVRPQYALTRILDSTVDPIERSELSNYVENRAADNKDPWTPVTASGFFDPETRVPYVVIGAYDVRDALSNLLEAYVDNAAAHPEAVEQLPLVTFAVRKFIKNDGSPGYAAQFDIDGWVDRPAAVLHIKPPPLTVTTEAAKSDDAKAAETTPDKAADDAKRSKRRIRAQGDTSTDFHDEIPF